jgi:hypothetical protein
VPYEATDEVSGYADLSCNFEEEDESSFVGLLQVEAA